MDCEEVLKILDRGEDSQNQFKQRFDSIDKLAAEIVAFANSAGGLIIIGISDQGELVGLSKEDVSQLNQWISNATGDKIDKQIFVNTEILQCTKKRIMIIKVPRGLNKPYAINRTDVWIKSGADKRRAPIEEILRLAQDSGLHYADEVETKATFSDFDIDFFIKKYKELYQEEIEELNIPIQQLITNLKLLNNQKLTMAGLLIFGKNPGILKPHYRIKATYFSGNERDVNEFKDKQEIDGKLIEQHVASIAFIKRNLRRIQMHNNFNAPGTLEIPVETFSEILANAIVHRNYYISSPIQIYLFENRLEIISPGNLPNSLNEENIKIGVHIERNPIILSFLEKDPTFHYTGRGTGIPRVLKICRKANIKIEFINDTERQQFITIFYRK